MADLFVAPGAIIAQHSEHAGQWTAHFEQKPHVAFGGDVPVVAIRRLLEGTDAPPDSYTLRCDQDIAGSNVLLRTIVWHPPELLFPCGACAGRGKYVGLLVVEECKVCGGRCVVPV